MNLMLIFKDLLYKCFFIIVIIMIIYILYQFHIHRVLKRKIKNDKFYNNYATYVFNQVNYINKIKSKYLKYNKPWLQKRMVTYVSLNVLYSASKCPAKYVIKYFKIANTRENINLLKELKEDIANLDIVMCQLNNYKRGFYNKIKKDFSLLSRGYVFRNINKICNIPRINKDIKFPIYLFCYTSPKKRSKKFVKIELVDIINDICNILDKKSKAYVTESNPMIYAYKDRIPEHEGLLKVGYTSVDVDKRVAQQFPTMSPFGDKPYVIVLRERAIRKNGMCFTDKDIHRVLVDMGFERMGKSEWFRCNTKDVMKAINMVRNSKDTL